MVKKIFATNTFLLSGGMLILCIINRFSIIKIDITKVFPVVIDSTASYADWPLAILFMLLIIKIPLRNNKLFEKSMKENREYEYYDFFAKIATINSLIELIAAICSLAFCAWLYLCSLTDEPCECSFVYCLVLLGIVIRFVDAVYHHFYFKNLEIVHNALDKRRIQEDKGRKGL